MHEVAIRGTIMSLSLMMSTERHSLGVGCSGDGRAARAARTAVALTVKLSVVLAPLVAFQAYGYALFCGPASAWALTPRPWCSSSLPYRTVRPRTKLPTSS